jgi:hypothetical protein
MAYQSIWQTAHHTFKAFDDWNVAISVPGKGTTQNKQYTTDTIRQVEVNPLGHLLA